MVVIACPGDARSTATDRGGRFEFEGLPARRCMLSGSAQHFASTLIEVDLSASASTTARIVLPVMSLDQSVVVTTSGARETATDTPESVSIIGERELAMRPYQVLPQVLREEAGVAVQQTTAAAGSPVIRGFTGQGNIHLLDGVRLNTSMWRSGPVQYFAWLSPSNIERLELVRGPVSVQYGSDALGGAFNVISARPAFSSQGLTMDGRLEATVASGDRSAGLDGTVSAHTPRAAIALSVARKSVDDLRPGGGIDSHAAVARYFGLANRGLYERLPGTGYEQWGTQVAGQARVGAVGVISGLYRRDRQSGVNRYDRLSGGEGLFRSEIAPQRFDFGFLRYEQPAVPLLGGIRATVSVNRQVDGTLEQARPLASSAINAETTSVLAIGYQLHGYRRVPLVALSYGLDVFDESIDATRSRQVGTVSTPVRPLIPDGTTYRSVGMFAQASRDLLERLSVRGGLRYNRYTYETKAAPAFSIAAENVAFDALTFNASASVKLTGPLRATFNVSRGFRAANAADLGSIGVSGGGGFEISPTAAGDLGATIGSTDGADAVSTGRRAGNLLPESEMAYEAGLRYAGSRIGASVTAFHLDLRDAIQRRALIFSGDVVGREISGREIVRMDEGGRAYIAIDPRPVATRANGGRARIRGFDATASARLSPAWTARGWFSMANGEDLETGKYLRRMNPPMGGAAIAWAGPRQLQVEGVVTFARAQTRLASGDLSDARIGGRRTASSIAGYFNGGATDAGLVSGGILLATGETLAQVQARVLGDGAYLFDEAPGFVAVGVRGMYPLSPKLDLIVIGENLADRNYRLIGSGVDAPGRNVQARLRLRF